MNSTNNNSFEIAAKKSIIETYINKYDISFTSAKYKLCLEQINRFEKDLDITYSKAF